MEYQHHLKQRDSNTGGVIEAVAPDSIAAELGLKPGDRVIAVDDLRLRDVIDYRYATAEEAFTLRVQTASGQRAIAIEKDWDEDLGILFTEPLFDRLRTCNNKCPFCFLTQMPKGMRKTLYLKDDDYRLSFLYGNFVTFTNLSDEDWQRIAEQHLSPLYMSVHATEPVLRAVMLGKPDVPDPLEHIRRLATAGIEVHTQVVACPGANDGPALHRTIQDLAAWYPTVQSISVVPVGLTRFRFDGKRPSTIRTAIQVHETPEWIDSNWERQPLWSDSVTAAPTAAPDPTEWGFCSRLGAATDIPLRCYTPDEAARLIDEIEPYQQHFVRELSSGLVYPSDEFYILCGRELPPAAFYDDFPQYSNGIGMVREFLDEWAAVQHDLPPRLAEPLTLALVCGTLITPIMAQVVARLNQIEHLEVRLLPVVNQFFGETVTVSGLLMGQDVVPVLRASGCTRALLPRVMFDHTDMRTLDDYSLDRIGTEAGVVAQAASDAADLVQAIRQIAHEVRALTAA